MKRLIPIAIVALAVLPAAAHAATTTYARSFLVDSTLGNAVMSGLIPQFDTVGETLDSVEITLLTRWSGMFDVTNTNGDIVVIGEDGRRAIGAVTTGLATVAATDGPRYDISGSQLNVRSLAQRETTTVSFSFQKLSKITLTSDFSDFLGSDDLEFNYFAPKPTLTEIQGQPAAFLLKSWQTLSTLTVTYRSSPLEGPPSTAVPEPATWALLIAGFGVAGARLRVRRKAGSLAA